MTFQFMTLLHCLHTSGPALRSRPLLDTKWNSNDYDMKTTEYIYHADDWAHVLGKHSHPCVDQDLPYDEPNIAARLWICVSAKDSETG